jgi:predicted nucleic acid-binding protein
VVARKRPDLLGALGSFLREIDYELASPKGTSITIADSADQPILDAALDNDVDVIVTGDKAFLAVSVDAPLILTPRAFLGWTEASDGGYG